MSELASACKTPYISKSLKAQLGYGGTGEEEFWMYNEKSLVESYSRQPSTPDSLLWPKVIYSVQARGNEFSHGIAVMFMHEYTTLIRILEPLREKG